jgi:hypothetical protein
VRATKIQSRPEPKARPRSTEYVGNRLAGLLVWSKAKATSFPFGLSNFHTLLESITFRVEQMATKAQIDFFSRMYDEQAATWKNIQERAKFYFAVISFYLGVILFKIQDVSDVSKLSRPTRWFSVTSAVVLSASLFFALFAARVRSYEIPCDPEKLLSGDQLKEEGEFLEDRIVDFAVAINRIRQVNNKAADQMRIAGWLMFAAIGIQVFGLIWLSFFYKGH